MNFSLIFLVSFTKAHPWEEVWLFAWPPSCFSLGLIHSVSLSVGVAPSRTWAGQADGLASVEDGRARQRTWRVGFLSVLKAVAFLSVPLMAHGWCLGLAHPAGWSDIFTQIWPERAPLPSSLDPTYFFKVIEAGPTEQKLTTIQSLGPWKLRHLLAPL